MKILPFLTMISILFLLGLGVYYFGGEWQIFSTLFFAFDLVLIAIKVGNWWRGFRDNL